MQCSVCLCEWCVCLRQCKLNPLFKVLSHQNATLQIIWSSSSVILYWHQVNQPLHKLSCQMPDWALQGASILVAVLLLGFQNLHIQWLILCTCSQKFSSILVNLNIWDINCVCIQKLLLYRSGLQIGFICTHYLHDRQVCLHAHGDHTWKSETFHLYNL